MGARLAAAAIVVLAALTQGHASAGGGGIALARHERSSEVRANGALLGTVHHAPGAVVRGDRLGRGAVIVADLDGSDYGAALFRVDARGAAILARGVYHASRPLASRDGKIYVERGAPGPWPTREEARAGRLRTDALAIDAVDPETGDARTLYTSRGYTLHLAGETDREIVAYRVAFEGADLVAIDRASGAARVVRKLAPYARDFSLLGNAVVMRNRDGDAWTIEKIDLASGARAILFADRERAPVPRVLASGEVTWSAAAPVEEALDETVR